MSSILYTWIYNNTGRSTLAALLFHFMQNFTGELFALPTRAEVLQTGVWIVAATVVLRVWGARTLTGRQDEPTSGPPLVKAGSRMNSVSGYASRGHQ